MLFSFSSAKLLEAIVIIGDYTRGTSKADSKPNYE